MLKRGLGIYVFGLTLMVTGCSTRVNSSEESTPSASYNPPQVVSGDYGLAYSINPITNQETRDRHAVDDANAVEEMQNLNDEQQEAIDEGYTVPLDHSNQ